MVSVSLRDRIQTTVVNTKSETLVLLRKEHYWRGSLCGCRFCYARYDHLINFFISQHPLTRTGSVRCCMNRGGIRWIQDDAVFCNGDLPYVSILYCLVLFHHSHKRHLLFAILFLELDLLCSVLLLFGRVLFCDCVVSCKFLFPGLGFSVQMSHVDAVSINRCRPEGIWGRSTLCDNVFIGSVIAVFNQIAARMVIKRFGTTSQEPRAIMASLLRIKCGCVSNSYSPATVDQTITGACNKAVITVTLASLRTIDCSSTAPTVAIGFSS